MTKHVDAQADARFAPIPYRVRIGVTGHRVLEDPELAACRVREILATAIDQFFDNSLPPQPRVTPMAFTVVTALAEGADRLVAREALRTVESELEVVLPFAREDYLKDFATDESRREFDEYCDRAAASGSLDCARPGRTTPNATDHDVRRAGYLRAGRAVVDRCDILVALWDGQPAHGVGGTSEIVEHARALGRPLVIVAVGDHCSVHVERGELLDAAAFRRTEVFNTFKVNDGARDAHEADASQQMFGGTAASGIPEQATNLIRERIIPYYSRAALIAEQSKQRYARAGLAAYVLSPFAVAAVAIGVLEHELSLIGGIIELTLLLLVLGIVMHADRHKVHKKWIGARFVAERLRTAMFCAACGLQPKRTGVPPWLLHLGGADAWAYRACDEIVRRLGTLPGARPEDFDAIRAFAQGVWFDEQIAYCKRRAEETGDASRRLETAGKWAFGGAIGAAVLHLVFVSAHLDESLPLAEKMVVLLALVLPAFGASLGGIRTHREFSRLERRHRAMAGTLRHMNERYAAAETLDELNELIRETEAIMLQDAGEWLALMRYVRIEAA